MTIHIDEPNFKTVVLCDVCGATAETTRPDGVVPPDWATGHLWLDISLTEQRQTPICFCPECGPGILSATTVRLVAEAD